jgi:hypothetical protein
MTRASRIVVALAALLLLLLYVTPLWRIELHAPQYPEGLGLRIWVDQIAGANPNDLNSINGLNHYIGMHAIEPDDFPELRLMPWLLGGLIAGGLLVALIGRRGPLYAWLQLIALGYELSATADRIQATAQFRGLLLAGSGGLDRCAHTRDWSHGGGVGIPPRTGAERSP